MDIAGILMWTAAACAAWLALERVLARVLPMFERRLPDDICGPDGWLFDTANRTGIFDLPAKRRRG